MKKLEKLKLLFVIAIVIFISYNLLKLTYNDGVKNCIDYGYSESYCRTELSK